MRLEKEKKLAIEHLKKIKENGYNIDKMISKKKEPKETAKQLEKQIENVKEEIKETKQKENLKQEPNNPIPFIKNQRRHINSLQFFI